MRPQSAKAKGRRLQQEVRDAILATFSPQLQPGDVRSTSMGAGGEDILLSPAAFRAVPFAIECKNQEALNIWAALDQAAGHSPQENGLLVFKRNGTATYAALRFDQLLDLLQRAHAAAS